MEEALSQWYERAGTASALTAQLPPELGRGSVSILTTAGGLGLSCWQMRYDRDTYVSGGVGDQLRLLFCLGEGVEWTSSQCGHSLRLDSWEGCLCLDEGAVEKMCYEAGTPYAFYTVRIPRKQGMELLGRYFSGEGAEKMLRERDARPFSIPREGRELLESLLSFPVPRDGFAMMRMEAKVQELLAVCLEGACEGRRGGLKPGDAQRMREVKERIDREIYAVPGIAELAREAAVSPSKLSRDFKEYAGLPLHAYVIERRLCEAAGLLRTGEYSVGEVAQRVGYAKAGQFSEAFKRRFGVLPKDY